MATTKNHAPVKIERAGSDYVGVPNENSTQFSRRRVVQLQQTIVATDNDGPPFWRKFAAPRVTAVQSNGV